MNIAGNRNVFHPHDISLSVYRIKINDFNLDHSLSCGQVFRWEKKDWWTGIVNGVIVRAKQEDGELIVESSFHKELIIDYFRLDDDIQQIYASIGRDEKIASLINKYRGLRLIRQDPWECLISYMCSSNNTILNITNSIRRMCECFGNEIEKDFYSFPTPQALSCAPLCDMSQCRLGFRAPRVLKIEALEIRSRIACCFLHSGNLNLFLWIRILNRLWKGIMVSISKVQRAERGMKWLNLPGTILENIVGMRRNICIWKIWDRVSLNYKKINYGI